MSPARRRPGESRAAFRRRTPDAAAKAEYRRRLEQNRGLPTAVARGHGPIPARIARGVEKQRQGRPRALPVKTQEKYRKGIGAYEKKYRGGLVTGRTVGLVFPSEKVARAYVVEYLDLDPESEYVEIREEGDGTWTVTLLR